MSEREGTEPNDREQSEEPDFDGGLRSPAPAPADPEAEHDQTVLQIVQEARWDRSTL
jgi:hypothetical protein